MIASAWGIVNKRGDLLAGCIRSRRTAAIKALVGKEEGWQKRWRVWRTRWGCAAVRVECRAYGGIGHG